MNQDQIRQKYQPAFQEMERQQVRVTDMRMQGDRLYVLAQAPSEDAKNKVWDIIKQVDPTYQDLICDIRVAGAQQETSPVHDQFDKIAGNASPASLAQGLSAAFKSKETPPFSEMVGHLFSHSSGEQRAGLLHQLMSASPSALATEVAGMMRGGRQITPESAQQVSPEAVQNLAAKAEQHDPSVVDRISQYYAAHPNLVKTLGIGTLTFLVSHMTEGLRRRSGGGA